MEKPFIKTGYLGLCIIIMSLVLLFAFPANTPHIPEGFFTPILAFEFIETQQDVLSLFGYENKSLRDELIRKMNLGNYLDYIFMTLYTMFISFFSISCFKITKKKIFLIPVFLSLLILICDAFENVQLLSITNKIDTGAFEKELINLYFFTWIKWLSIPICFIIFSFYFLKRNFFAKIIGISAYFSFFIGISAFYHKPYLCELLEISIAVNYIMITIYSFVQSDSYNYIKKQ